MLVCLLLLEGMKRRFVFISRFSIAGGLASGAVVVQFPVCVCVCLRVLKRIRVYVCLCLHAGAHTYSKGLLCVHVCICARLCVSPLAWRSLYRPEQNSLVESSYQSHVRGGEEGEGERR